MSAVTNSTRRGLKPVLKPKPQGANVRAFIESLESGSKPKADFFKFEKKPIITTPKPALRPKPSLVTLHETVPDKNVLSDDIYDIGDVAPPEDLQTKLKSEAVSDHGSTEDSGISSCELKYSGSLSSNHSSNEQHYQAISSSSSEPHYHAVWQCEISEYSETGEITETNTTRSKISIKSKASAHHYHIPGRANGTLSLPRARGKKGAVLGKAVARGRITKKRTDDPHGSCSAQSDNRSTLTPDPEQDELFVPPPDTGEHNSDYDNDVYEYSGFGSDFKQTPKGTICSASDSSWETDGEASTLAQDKSAEDKELQKLAKNHRPQSKTEWYCNDEDETEKLATLMRSTSKTSRASRNINIRRRPAIRRINEGNKNRRTPSMQELAKKCSSKLGAVRSLLGRFRKSKLPKQDHEEADSIVSHTFSNSSLLNSNLTEGINPNKTEPDSASATSTAGSVTLPDMSGIQKVEVDVKKRSSSLCAPPPPPPRLSIYIPGFDEDTPAPRPPPRTSSLIPDNTLSPINEKNKKYTPLFAKASSSPRSPKLHSKAATAGVPSLDISVRKSLNCRHSVTGAELCNGHSLDKASSFPCLRSDDRPPLPERRESSRSLLISPSHDDESLVRKNEILSSAAKTSLSRNNSAVTVKPSIIEEEPTITVIESSVAGENNSDEDEPLYQEYHANVLNTLSRKHNQSIHSNMSTASSGSTQSAGVINNNTSTLLRSKTPGMALWSCTPQVKNSSVLDHMNEGEIKLQEAMYEVITSEASYLKSLNMLNRVFVNSKQFSDPNILPVQVKKALFSNVTAVQEVSNRLFAELDKHWKDNIILTAVCEIIYKYALKEFDVYIKYCSTQAFQERTLKRLNLESKEFQEALAQLERSPECHGLNMSSFLLLPMQRITRLPLLLDAILRRQEIWSDQGRAAQLCYEQVKKIVKKCNEGARKMEQTEQVLNIENKLNFIKCKKIPLGSAARHLIKHGGLTHLSMEGTRTANLLTARPKTLHLYLFNDLLIITKKKTGDQYSVLDYSARINVDTEVWSLEALSDNRLSMMAQRSSCKFIFMLALLENHNKKHSEYLFGCATETERTRWVDAFSSQVGDDPDDKVYESWDCPQVQVVHDYPANQPDELDLFAGDVLNILRKTADGWYEGEKVSDGQTGWIPSSYTVELNNDHVRAKHLKNRYKFLKAAATKLKT